jgi:Cdc6-like AAA superfamily ATPase
MKLFPQDNDVVIYETGFEGDLLERRVISKQLSELVEKIEDPVVLALDDKWGAGKTYFLKRWVAAHQRENGGAAVTVYFDAFENDYLSDPFVSIIAALSDRIPSKQRKTLEKWKAVAVKLAKPTFNVALNLATFGMKQYLDEVGDIVADSASSEAKDATKGLWEQESLRKDALKTFKELLKKITEEQEAPIVVVVDELDRCRPDYALSVMEVIKHFFSVPRVHFVLGVNGEGLQNSVRARYGADIDAERYLRKFISASFSLPRLLGPRGSESAVVRYASHLVSEMEIPKRISDRCINLLSLVSANNEVSLRDVGKVLSRIALVPQEVSQKNYMGGWIDTLCILLVASVVDPILHRKLVLATAPNAEIRRFLGATSANVSERFGEQHNSEYNHNLAFWFASALYVCGADSVEDDVDLPEWKREIGNQFDQFGAPREPKRIPATIQKDWVEVFRI